MTQHLRRTLVAGLLAHAAAGCGGAEPQNRSEVATADPARFATAKAEAEAAAEAARQAEARALRGKKPPGIDAP